MITEWNADGRREEEAAGQIVLNECIRCIPVPVVTRTGAGDLHSSPG